MLNSFYYVLFSLQKYSFLSGLESVFSSFKSFFLNKSH
uniref:Uncharacterized protein n=1 Tax=uncultured Flavobacteriia bacterium TaxID=212695 RepID=H6RID5_9BACT|nr:hypothetical protein VIS_S3CEB40034 [uncultured Flavobacteriia bacterium]